MERISFILLMVLFCISCNKETKTFTEAEISIVPKPVKMEIGKQSFQFSEKVAIIVNDDAQKPAANYLFDLCKNATVLDVPLEGNLKASSTVYFVKDETIQPEGYSLEITKDKIVISANDAAGYFYGVQTLRQLLPSEIEKSKEEQASWKVPCITIKDAPRFSWRGMHMDFSRHFFSVEEVKIFLDYMALYKLNTYHMHLTDDQGWRVEIKKYPLLTEKGAWRIESSHDKACKELAETDPSYKIDETHYHEREGERMYGGFFTQEQIKEIVAYAAERQIEVVPEIDMPGHFKSAIDNYPYLSCTGEAGWGQTFSIPACLGKDTAYQFCKDILAEIADLFPSKYIHIGGDEVNIKSWHECMLCQGAIKDHNLKDEHELQSFFNKDVEAFLKTKGKRLIGWDEIVEGGLSEDATMMWWRNWAPTMRYIAADNGNDMIICPDFEYYFDFKNDATPLDKVYNYEPIPEDFTKDQAKHVLGVQANLWSEYIPNFKRLQYQTFPRMLALAETGWTSKQDKNFDDFQERMKLQYERLDALNIQYYIPSVVGLSDKVAFLDKASITLQTPLEEMEIYYTLDGTVPTKASTKYTGPIEISETSTLNTVAYRGNIASEVKSALVEKQTYREALEINPTIGSVKRWIDTKQFNEVTEVQLPSSPKFEQVVSFDLKGYEDSDHVSMVFKGYFLAKQDGLYEFVTKSDDGSLLYIGDTLVVDNGGNHAAILKAGMIALKKGWHPLMVKYHEQGGGNELTVWYAPPNEERQILNRNNIGHD